ncbi:MAG: hypothetical protein J6U61_02275 [Lachnospiraceae bacterium]|nr:hypothetical protein [Lachnospiraceae bacterium]
MGAAFIIISFFIVGGNERTPRDAARSALDANVLEQMHEDFVEKANKRADFLLHETEDKLESLSNDKIIAVGEYSDQMLEKIESNHKEVVFLYQMLNEKEEALKSTVLGMENTRIECEKMIRDAEAAREAVDKAAAAAESRLSAAVAARAAKPAVQTTAAAGAKPAAPAARTAAAKPAASAGTKTAAAATGTAPAKTAGTAAKPASGGTGAKPAARPQTVRPAAPAAPSFDSMISASTENLDTGAINRNDEIIALHKSGKSVMEISKLLGMGQGEVKLIIDLYC